MLGVLYSMIEWVNHCSPEMFFHIHSSELASLTCIYFFNMKEKKKVFIWVKIESLQNIILSVVVVVYQLPEPLFSNAFFENCFAMFCKIMGPQALLTSYASLFFLRNYILIPCPDLIRLQMHTNSLNGIKKVSSAK